MATEHQDTQRFLPEPLELSWFCEIREMPNAIVCTLVLMCSTCEFVRIDMFASFHYVSGVANKSLACTCLYSNTLVRHIGAAALEVMLVD
jgi:hypothetical protein